MCAQKRDLISINDISNSEIEEIFELADEYSRTMASPDARHQIRGRRPDAANFILATLFYEPSTRTRFSFEAAMVRLGGNILGSTDPTITSAAKGESLADTARVLENYCDLIVIRHSFEGAARAASEYVSIPVINGGDGSHEHPTQTLCDLYTLRKENKSLQGLNVLLVGDLRNGRTVHSLVYALARFGANILTMPGDGLELPEEVSKRLQSEFGCVPIERGEVSEILEHPSTQPPIGAVYVAPSGGTQLTLLKEDGFDSEKLRRKLKKKIDVCYVTRLQGERLKPDDRFLRAYPIVNSNFLKGKSFNADTRVLHPLPRVAELGYELDRDPRGVYFKQAGYGVPVRMALISKVLGVKPFASKNSQNGTAPLQYEHKFGVLCPNSRCITHNETEQRYLANRFWVISNKPPILRCTYCESTLSVKFIGNRETHTYSSIEQLEPHGDLSRSLFPTEQHAEHAGYRPHHPVRRQRA